MRAIVATCAVILAVAFVTSVTVDLGPSLRKRAETAGSNFIKRPMHIGGPVACISGWGTSS